MTSHIRINKAEGTWVVRTTDGVIAESQNALELTEGSYAPVIYFPREDIGMAFLETSATRTRCPHKGEASYFSIAGQGAVLQDAAWSYETPKTDVQAIQNHIAFSQDKVTVERL